MLLSYFTAPGTSKAHESDHGAAPKKEFPQIFAVRSTIGYLNSKSKASTSLIFIFLVILHGYLGHITPKRVFLVVLAGLLPM